MDQQVMERMILRNDAYTKISNMMGTYSFLLTAGKYKDMVNLFAKKAPDVRAEMNWGVYDGYEGIVRLYAKYHNDVIVGPGCMAVHALTTPVIEVAGDLKTAKAVWVSPGHMTGGPFSPADTFKAHWAWMKYGCDFILEDPDGQGHCANEGDHVFCDELCWAPQQATLGRCGQPSNWYYHEVGAFDYTVELSDRTFNGSFMHSTSGPGDDDEEAVKDIATEFARNHVDAIKDWFGYFLYDTGPFRFTGPG
ncbi:MAG: SnoaL-like domain-containing protein, partial [Clostridiales bacterium]|nr:SnoaL-like domain-containing protein [Clostridiales bacterium]